MTAKHARRGSISLPSAPQIALKDQANDQPQAQVPKAAMAAAMAQLGRTEPRV